MGQGDGSGADVGKFFKGLGDKIQNNDWVNKARDEVGKAGKQIAEQGVDVNGVHVDGKVLDRLQGGDWRSLANDKNVQGLARIAGGAMFPQAAAANIGADLIGGFVGRRQGRQMLEDPKELGNRLVANFDSMDANKNGFIEGDELRDSSALRTLLSGNMDNLGAVAVLDKGYSKFAALDGADEKQGISKRDVELFAIGADPEKRSAQVWGDTKSGAIWGGVLGTAFGVGKCLFGAKGNALATIGLRLGISAAVGGVIGNLWGRHESGKTADKAQEMVDWLKREL